MMKNVVNFAHEVLDMQDRIMYLEDRVAKLEKYEQLYNDLLDESMNHGRAMMGNMLKLFMTPGVVKACEDNRTFIETPTEN